MKIFLSLILLFTGFATASSTRACDMPEGFHEFVTFGEKSVFLSHYPMFGSIHSYQILLKVELSQNGQNINESFLALRKSKANAIFSTSPVRSDGEEAYAVLPNYAKGGAHFVARIHYEGSNHKEVEAFKNVTVTVKEVLINRLMNQPKVGETKPAELQYFYAGNQDEAYLVHQMQWNPDFDQIVQINPLPAVKPECQGALTITNRKNSDRERLLPNQNTTARTSCNDKLSILVRREIYQEQMTIQH